MASNTEPMAGRFALRAKLCAREWISESSHAVGQPAVEGQLLSLSASQLSLRFESARAPLLAVGREVGLELSARDADIQLAATAVVEQRIEQPGERVYRLALCSTAELTEFLGPFLNPVDTRRRQVRVEPANLDPIAVDLRPRLSLMSITGQVLNLSSKGLLVQLDAELEQEFVDVERLQVCFELPGADRRVHAWARIRHRSYLGRCVHYGLELEAADLGGLQLAALMEYIQSRVETLELA